MIGAKRLAMLCAEFEKKAKAGGSARDSEAAFVEELLREWVVVREELRHRTVA